MKKILIAVLIIITISIIIPPIIHHYIYPTNGDDTASHLLYFMDMDNPDPSWPYSTYPLYYGQEITGRFLNLLPIDIHTSFMWFHYAVLITGIWIIGLTVGYSINMYGGIVASLLVFGRSYLMMQFQWGIIFDIIGIIVLLPLIIICFNNFWENNWWKLGFVASCAVFFLNHVNGKYLLGILPAFILFEIARYLLNKNKPAIYRWIDKYRYVNILGITTLALLAAYVFQISIDPSRIFLDASILMMIFVASIIAILIANMKKKVLVAVSLAVIVAIYPQVYNWFGNNSAIKDVDREAIEYVNSLDDGDYELSSEITENIYKAYINKSMNKNGNANYIITRSDIMTTTSAIMVQDFYKELPLELYNEIAEFTDDGITVKIYEKNI